MIELPQHSPRWPEQPRGFDLFSLPGVRHLIRWRYARLIFQLPLLLLAVMALLDGFLGQQLAPRNVATTSIWLHYRGLVVLVLALFGNAFCAACPLMLTRGLSKRLDAILPRKFPWPTFLKNKVFVTLLMVGYFYTYEVFNLWASPWLSAWLIIGYFSAALMVDTLFPAGTFCKYVCPLGNFNFVFATASPTQLTATDPDICSNCKEKPCLHGRESYSDTSAAKGDAAFIPLSSITHANGAGYFPGCETNLMVPTITSNMDCTYCFNCVRACPYDNVALRTRALGYEWVRQPWRKGRVSVMVLGILLTFWGLLNAFAMIKPYYAFATFLAETLHTQSEAIILALIIAAVTALGFGLTLLVALAADRLGGLKSTPREALMRWGYIMLPLGFGFWGAHYLFHFLTGALSIVPVVQNFFAQQPLLVAFNIDPNWRLSRVVPMKMLFPIGAAVVSGYALLSLYVSLKITLRDFGRRGALALWPPLIFITAFALLSIWILSQPMEMRGTIFGPTY